MEVSKEKIRNIFATFFFDKDENASQAPKIVNAVYDLHTATEYYVQFYICRLRSGYFNDKDASRIGKSVVENVDKITAGYKNKLDVWVPHQLTQKKRDGLNFHLRSLSQTERNRLISYTNSVRGGECIHIREHHAKTIVIK